VAAEAVLVALSGALFGAAEQADSRLSRIDSHGQDQSLLCRRLPRATRLHADAEDGVLDSGCQKLELVLANVSIRQKPRISFAC